MPISLVNEYMFFLGYEFIFWLTCSNRQVKWRQVALLERDILLKNLKSVLESLRGQVTGKTKDEIEESISMVGFFISYTSGVFLVASSFILSYIYI